MSNTHLIKERRLPLWAIGSTAIGVPLMVALLALVAPKGGIQGDGMESGATTEWVENQSVDRASRVSYDCTVPPRGS